MQKQPLLGLKLDQSLAVVEVVRGGACDGFIKVGDVITDVDSISVVGQEPSAVVALCNSYKVILHVTRKDGSSTKSRQVLVRPPVSRPALTRAQAKKQLEAGLRIHQDDQEIRRVFTNHAIESKEDDRYANIPKAKLVSALQALGSELSEKEVDDFIKKNDVNGDGVIDYDEFKQVLLTPFPLPDDKAIRSVFNHHADMSSGEPHIPNDKVLEAVRELKINNNAVSLVKEYFSQGAAADGLISYEEFRQAILSTSPMPEEQDILRVYEEHAIPGKFQYIPKDKLRVVLEDLGLTVTDEQLAEMLRNIDFNFDGRIKFNALKHAVTSPSPLETWAQTLPLARLVADALPKHATCDHLRVVSTMTPGEVDNVAEEVARVFKVVLLQSIDQLKRSYKAMDEHVLKPGEHSAGKFEVVQMTGGTINDFYGGLEARIGTCPANFKEVMEAEHCTLPMHDEPFNTLNYTDIKTFPKKEWDIVMKKQACPEEEMRFYRRIPDISQLLQLASTKRARLTEAEIISIVLYTGPMYVIYNMVLRKFPTDMYDKFKRAENLFSTTIFVLASAVQKISRIMQLPKGLVLYRGLGGTSDLPESFFKRDENGCSGFVEWGFMSTTASKQVAISYSGLSKHKPLPIVLAIQVGAADRGACIKNFSQYPSEVEYLYVPCSFVEQGGPEGVEVTSAGVVRVLPVKVNANLKSDTVDEFKLKKRTLHLASFRYRIHEIEQKLKELAAKHNAEARLQRDPSRDEKYSVPGFLSRIVEQCKEVYSRHEAVSPEDYNTDSKFRRLVFEMVDTKDMALSKVREWLENDQSSFIRFRWNAPLRTAHRRWKAFLSRKLLLSTAVEETRDESERLLNAKEIRDESVRLLIAKGMIIKSVNETNELGETVMMAAAAEGNEDLKLLVHASAEVNYSRPDGVTALWLAAQFGHSRTIRGLVKLKAEVNQAANDGATPVYIAAQGGNTRCIELLADFRADLTIADKNGLAPVHQAAMNGHSGSFEVLVRSGALPDPQDHNGSTPLDHAEKNKHADCADKIRQVLKASSVSGADNSKSAAGPWAPVVAAGDDTAKDRVLIISTGDISDVDGFLAVAEYAKTGADVLFVMNYPAYVGVAESEVDSDYADQNPGLGYRYSAREVLEGAAAAAFSANKNFSRFLDRVPGVSHNSKVKTALTDMAFLLANGIWDEIGGATKGRLLFCVGGINSVNPFSPTAIKNEIIVYCDLLEDKPTLLPVDAPEGTVYGSDGKVCTVEWGSYKSIYMDFNGSLAFWNDAWEGQLGVKGVVERMSGVFVMGGVYADQEPITMPSIPNVLNRFSSATMNQLYHPERGNAFFAFVAQNQIPTFVVTNNVVKDLTTFADAEKKVKTYDGVERFLEANELGGPFLRKVAKAHYTSQFNPPRKPFDFYTAAALRAWHESGHVHAALTARRKTLFYSNVSGITLVSGRDTWEEARESYIRTVKTDIADDDPPFVRNKKEYFLKEIVIMKAIQFAGKLPVFDLEFLLDGGYKLTIV